MCEQQRTPSEPGRPGWTTNASLSNSSTIDNASLITCAELVDSAMAFLLEEEPEAAGAGGVLGTLKRVVWPHFVLVICLFGIVGNLTNLVVLTHRSLVGAMKHMERSVNLALVGLAVSDMLYCLVYFVRACVKERTDYPQGVDTFALYFTAYREPLFNIFLFTSTWLTVIMALSRSDPLYGL